MALTTSGEPSNRSGVVLDIVVQPKRWHTEFALLYDREKQKGNRNRATLAIARKLVSYLLAIDRVFLPEQPMSAKSQQSFG